MCVFVFQLDQWLKSDFVWNAVRQLLFCINADEEHLFRWHLSVCVLWDWMQTIWMFRIDRYRRRYGRESQIEMAILNNYVGVNVINLAKIHVHFIWSWIEDGIKYSIGIDLRFNSIECNFFGHKLHQPWRMPTGNISLQETILYFLPTIQLTTLNFLHTEILRSISFLVYKR